VDEHTTSLPDILCAVQVCLEGEISKDAVAAGFARGERASGDLIPWTISQQFQDPSFASLSGARVVRIAVHPSVHRVRTDSPSLSLFVAGEVN
jgi:N-acetyltransferase 10